MSNLVKGKLYRLQCLISGQETRTIHKDYRNWRTAGCAAVLPPGAIFLFVEEVMEPILNDTPGIERAWCKVVFKDFVGWIWAGDKELLELTEDE